MAETLTVKVLETGEERLVADAEPLDSARLFWRISDAIWEQKPDHILGSSFSMPVEETLEDARDDLNETLLEIDGALAISGVGRALDLGIHPYGGAEVVLSPDLLAWPIGGYVGTFNWDVHSTVRRAQIDGKEVTVERVNGEKDRHRELYAGFHFRDIHQNAIQVTYLMQRLQTHQDTNVTLATNVWHSSFDESGYEGHALNRVEITEQQELALLNKFIAMSGLVIEAE